MKLSFSLLLQLFIFVTALSQDKVTYTPVIILPEIDSCIILRQTKNTSIYFGKFYYDSLARVDSSVIYDKYENRLLFESFKYDKKGRLIEEFSHDLPDEVGEYGKDDDSEWIRERRWHNRRTLIYYEYDKHNNLIHKKGYSANFDAASIQEEDLGFVGDYIYSDSNCLVKKIEYYAKRRSKNGTKHIDSTFFQCDGQNNHIQIIEKEHDKNPVYEYKYYNNFNKLIKSEQCYHAQKSCYQNLYEYDELLNYKSFKRIDNEGEEFENHQYTYEDTLLKYYIYTIPRGDKKEMFFEYDSLGVITLSHTRELDASPYRTSNVDLNKYKFKYDSLNRIIDKEIYWEKITKKNFRAREEYYYNDKSQIIKKRNYNQLNKLNSIKLLSYNDNGFAHREIGLNKDSIVDYSEIYFYDSLGVKIARERYDKEGFVTLYQTYKYDEKGNEIGGVHFQNGYNEIIYRYYYQKDGTYDYVHVQKKKGNKIIEDFNLKYLYYKRNK